MTSILQKMPVIISKKDAHEKYGVYNSQFNSFHGYFLLKKKTFEKITATVKERTKVRDAVMAEIKAVMGLNGEGKASGEATERFCRMNGLDINKAKFFMESSVPYVEAEAFVFFARQDDKIKDMVYLLTVVGDYENNYKILNLSEDCGGNAFCERYGNCGREDKIEDIKQEISSRLKKGFVAVHGLYRHEPDMHYPHLIKTLYP